MDVAPESSSLATSDDGIASPARWRMWLRGGEVALVALAAMVGAGAGALVALMAIATQKLHELVFHIPIGVRLSAQADIDPWLGLLGPTVGGLLFGLVSWLVFRNRSQPIDPIEANALHGGRMSLRDSAIVAAQTVMSSGVGASVGLEAGYSQAAGGLASWLGVRCRLRRADLRLLVGCGAGAAIGAAFGAPLAGAFYAFELILGSYAIGAFAPVMAATFTASLTRSLLMGPVSGEILPHVAVAGGDFPALLLLGLLSAFTGIAVMRGVTLVESLFRRSGLSLAVRPAIGGAVVGLLGLVSPAVFSAGHGAVYHFLVSPVTLEALAILLLAKVLASSVSIGAGFRGGLFFASLLIGVLFGRLYGAVLAILWPAMPIDPTLLALTGMAALAVSIIGGPMTMTLMALEMTGQLDLTLAVLGAAGVASMATRRLFGFSFATWRFHLRGETIRSAHDVGWMRELTVEQLMRREVPMVRADLSVADVRAAYPPGATGSLVATDAEDRYRGMVPLAALYASDADPTASIEPLLCVTDRVLRPAMSIRDALNAFEESETEALAVVEGEARRVIGLLTEAHAIKRYSAEVSRRNRELTGE
ncbi:chloride channel protein [Ancylobacter sp. 6x-1]|uniref:Chloride channel protein n=1 Tax=Ancylobacter crimeensis TaxID=2579147 RepID=A0ABT0DCJ1_9HYPH|nr:chloride channel protein [Ancylobacter crimeensis]MCK0197683.1 chloride channel protein [Ancylobacter crimeensis]